jgi:hypothetical protein
MLRPRFVVSLLGMVLLATAHADPSMVKAKVEEPVLQELMGGCSLKCAFSWGVELQAPGAKPATLKVLNDDNAETAWMAPEGTTGAGVRLKFLFPKRLSTELQGTPLYGLDLINGVWKSEEQWKEHGRVKKARLYYNDKPFLDVAFADSRRWQRLSFPDILVHSGDSMTFEILEVYPGKNGSGAAITEIVLQGAH